MAVTVEIVAVTVEIVANSRHYCQKKAICLGEVCEGGAFCWAFKAPVATNGISRTEVEVEDCVFI